MPVLNITDSRNFLIWDLGLPNILTPNIQVQTGQFDYWNNGLPSHNTTSKVTYGAFFGF
jgi:hypothetical protein